MIRFIRDRKRFIVYFLLLSFVGQLITPSLSYALTGGPTQPEVHSFQPAGTSDMVDLFTGDFSYNIPLFELPGPNGGYPFNLSYQSGISMDQEASWVGLGWNLNPGAITRQMRGLPDEFKGDDVHTKTDINPSVTVGLGAGIGVEIFGGDGASLGLGFGVTHNNYRGMGYSIDASLGLGGAMGDGMTGGIGLSVGLDSKEGANISPSLSLNGMAIGVDYNSKQGLHSVSLTQSSIGAKNSYDTKSKNGGKWSNSISRTSVMSLSHPGYTPQISMPMKNISISASFKAGGSWWGIYGAPYVRGFYNEQWLKSARKRIKFDAYGYLNYQHATEDNAAMLDFNREKDGIVTKESPNLAIPSATYDIYTATAQGMAAMYRPMRNDVGILRDPETVSTSTSGSGGVDVGPAASHVGVNLSINHSKSVSGAWTGGNGLSSAATFTSFADGYTYEPWYFKVHGEPNSDNFQFLNSIGGDRAVRVRLDGSRNNVSATAVLEAKNWSHNAPQNNSQVNSRKQRNQVIQPYTNEQLLANGQELLAVFKVEYRDKNNVKLKYNRASNPSHHVTAFTALSADGVRYNYGIPAYNLHQEEATFSVIKGPGQVARVDVKNTGETDPKYDYAGTEEFLKRVEVPRYTHSHLLTSIVGPDYVDITDNGVTEDDLGYWVKFTYKKTTADDDRYKWRDPFSQAHVQEGWKTDPRDDHGSYTYGEKEIWYLVQAETKSHIAQFEIEEREDGKGVASRLQDANSTGKSLHRLKQITLYTRSAGPSFPLKVTKFSYDYSLCKNVFNNSTGNGKLTLKKIWFEYGNSGRGALNAYTFSYDENNPLSNPNYDMLAYDRWGNYKPYPAGQFDRNRDFPYVGQDPSEKAALDVQASAWSLKEIQLPTGGKILVDYEIDDYAYVQHLPAMQMVQIVPPSGDENAVAFNLSDSNMKVKFKLEAPIDESLTDSEKRKEIMKYLDNKRKQLFFKFKINLRSPGENFKEYISGYADIDFAADMGLEGATPPYQYGYFHVKQESNRNPFSMRAWQHLRTNQPELANSGRKLKQTSSTSERLKQIKSLGSMVTQVRQMFQGFYNFCSSKNWGRQVEATNSWIRLKSPDKIKYGGGLRVKQITMEDGWSDDEGVYGQVYEYTTQEEGNEISSGVAAYEPIIGGEENPFRYAKKYVQSVPLRARNNLFFEYPINESAFPGPQVGYGKVTVLSLPAAALAGKDVLHNDLPGNRKVFPTGENISYGTTGMTVHEFYTAKEFPVITDETEKQNKPYKLTIPVPLLGSVSVSKMTASQGYSVIINDMHGKAKKVSNYRQDPKGSIDPEPVSWIKYNYLQEQKFQDQQRVAVVRNVFKRNGDGTLSAATAQQISEDPSSIVTMGQETEFFHDMRQFEDNVWGGGANVNTDVVYIPLLFAIIPIPIPTVWPNISKSTTQLRTAVTNKAIFKSGILESTEAYDGGSLVKTNNLKWDQLTGAAVLTSVNNNFDNLIYSYSIPAYAQYQGMGAAYQNIGYTFAISNVFSTEFKPTIYSFSTSGMDFLFPGDELVLYSGSATPVARVIFMGEENGSPVLHSDAVLTESSYRATVVRSGFRNQLVVTSGTITALEDPTLPGETVTHSKTIKIPQ